MDHHSQLLMSGPDLYTLLGATRDASHQELKTCYQRAVLECHPDKLPGTCSREEKASAEQRFFEVDGAWKTLGSESSRKEYDARITDECRKPLPLNEEVDIDDMHWDEDEGVYTYSCRCGGEYIASTEDIDQNIRIVSCNTCTLSIRLVERAAEVTMHEDIHVEPT